MMMKSWILGEMMMGTGTRNLMMTMKVMMKQIHRSCRNWLLRYSTFLYCCDLLCLSFLHDVNSLDSALF
jgi:hypothetical protein